MARASIWVGQLELLRPSVAGVGCKSRRFYRFPSTRQVSRPVVRINSCKNLVQEVQAPIYISNRIDSSTLRHAPAALQ